MISGPGPVRPLVKVDIGFLRILYFVKELLLLLLLLHHLLLLSSIQIDQFLLRTPSWGKKATLKTMNKVKKYLARLRLHVHLMWSILKAAYSYKYLQPNLHIRYLALILQVTIRNISQGCVYMCVWCGQN